MIIPLPFRWSTIVRIAPGGLVAPGGLAMILLILLCLQSAPRAMAQELVPAEPLPSPAEEPSGSTGSRSLERERAGANSSARDTLEPEHIPAEHAQPVLVLRIGERLMDMLVARRFDRENAVDSFILGARVTGTARTQGEVKLRLGVDSERIAIFVVAKGTVRARTTSHRERANVYTSSVTEFTAFKPIVLRGQGWRSYPCQIRSSTQSVTDGVDSFAAGVVGEALRLANLIGSDVAREEVNRIADEDARRQIAASLDREAEPLVAQLETRLERLLQQPSWISQCWHEGRLRFSSSQNYAQVSLCGNSLPWQPDRAVDTQPFGGLVELRLHLARLSGSLAATARVLRTSIPTAVFARVGAEGVDLAQQMLPLGSVLPRLTVRDSWLIARLGTDRTLQFAALALGKAVTVAPPRSSSQEKRPLARVRFLR